MLKWIFASAAAHGLLIAVYVVFTSRGDHWKNDSSKASALPAGVVSVDYMPIVKKAVQTPVKQTESVAKTAVPKDSATTAIGAAVGAPAVDAAPSTVLLTGEPGQPALTLEQYVRWVRTHNISVEYPRMSRIRGEQGRVVVEIEVARRGSPVENARVSVSSGSALLDEASLETSKKWNYPPFQGPERVTILVSFKFVLEE